MTLQLLAKGTVVDLDLIERTEYYHRQIGNNDTACIRIIMKTDSWFEVDVVDLFESAKILFGLA
jgi:hypothetical protein